MKAKIISRNLLISYTLFFLLLSCSKKPENIGLDLVGNNRAPLGMDTTLQVFAYSEIEDSVNSKQTSINPLGTMRTATFGTVKASLYTHLRLSMVLPDFGTNPEPDSIILAMVYSGSYGNLNTQQNFTVHKITEAIYRETDSSYYSNNDIEYSDQSIGSMSFYPNPTDSIVVGEDTVAAELRIPLHNSFAEELLELSDEVYETSGDFINYLPGLYIKPGVGPAVGEGAILYFDMLAARSKVTLYYHNDTANSLSYDFVINESNARIGKYDHLYVLSTDPVFLNQVFYQNADSTDIGTEKLYVEGLGGVRTILKFPNLLAWADTANVIINEAKLELRSYPTTESYEPPAELVLLKFDEEGNIVFTEDQAVFTENYFGGVYNENTQSYFFRITLYIQQLLAGEPDNGLVIFPNARSVRANGLSFYGTDQNQPYRISLKLIYTRAD